MKTKRASWALVCLALWAAAPPAHAGVGLSPVASGLSAPVAVTHAGDGSGRLFITLQDGRIVIYNGSQVLATPFLDIRSLVLSGGERGLLSAAFHPNYPATPYFFVNYTRRSPVNDGATVIARYSVSGGNPNLADSGSGVVLLVIPQPFSNHNGGQIAFGADGYLYIGMGDGGSGGDPQCHGQRDDSLLGKMLRLDIDQNVDTPPFYGIPPTNPFVGPGNPPDEVWAKGLRNPWRFSFDRANGDLLIGDVGQGTREEIDHHPFSSPGGANYGWKVMEGFTCTGDTTGCPVTPPACDSPAYTLPRLDYDTHALGRCSVTGGYMYRGTAVPSMAGMYVFADYCSGEIFLATPSGSPWPFTVGHDSSINITTFGEDEAGELYVAGSGVLQRLFETNPLADLAITKTDGQTQALAGSPVTYTITASNAGPLPANGATVSDAFPASLTGVTWTCSVTGGANCGGGGGSGNIDRQVDLPAGGSVIFTATGTLSASATGQLSNTASVAPPSGVSDPTPGNNSATDLDTIVPVTNLAITKTDGQAQAPAGSPVTYTITASNAGPSPANGAIVTDTFPAPLGTVSWTCTPAGGASCGGGGGSGNINRQVNLPAGGSVTFTATGTLGPNATGQLSNTATVAVPAGASDPNPSNNSATDVDTIIPGTDLAISKTDGRTTASPGDSLTYTIVATNNGPNAVTDATVTDDVPDSFELVTWTCAGSGGGGCTGSGSGDIADSNVDLPVGASVTYLLSATVVEAPTGNLHNTATIAMPVGMVELSPANNSATDADTLVCGPQTILVPDGRALAFSQDGGVTRWFGMGLRIGSSYSVELRNAGGSEPPGTVQIFQGDVGCSEANSATTIDTSVIAPPVGAGSLRMSFTAGEFEPFFRLRLTTPAGGQFSLRLSVAETTLYSAAWSTNGTNETYYSIFNTTASDITAHLILRDATGAIRSETDLSIPAFRTAAVNTDGLDTPRNLTGTAALSHDGPPGAIVAAAAIANFSSVPAYVQPVPFVGVREVR